MVIDSVVTPWLYFDRYLVTLRYTSLHVVSECLRCILIFPPRRAPLRKSHSLIRLVSNPFSPLFSSLDSNRTRTPAEHLLE